MARQKRTCGSSPAGRGKGSAWAGVWSARTAPAGNVLNNKTTRKPVPTRIGLHRPLRCCRARDSQLGACYQSASRRVKPGRAFCLALAVLGSLADGCGEALPPPGTLVVAFDSDPDSLDPRFQTDANGARLADLLYAGLTRADAAGRRIPELARTWEMADSRSFVFRLRPDFRFPDGTAVTAADVKATYDAVRDPALASPKRAALATLSAIEAPDPTTVVMRLTEPFAPLLDATGLGILPAARAREAGDVTTGAGPFQLVSAERGDRLVLAPNPGYPDGAPRLRAVVVRIVPDELVRVLELRRGGVHLVEDAPEPETVAWLATVPSLLVRRIPGTSFVYLALNLRDPRLADRRVREAPTLALDREGLVRFVLGGAARPATGLLAPEHLADAPPREPPPDPRRARRRRAGGPSTPACSAAWPTICPSCRSGGRTGWWCSRAGCTGSSPRRAATFGASPRRGSTDACARRPAPGAPPAHRARGRDPRVRLPPPPARRPGGDHARRVGRARRRRGAPTRTRSRPPARGAVRPLPRARRARRPRPLDRLPGTRRPRDRGALPGDPRAGGRGLRAGPRLRPAARRAGRGPAWNGARPRRPPGKPLRRLPAELLAGSAPDARLLDPARVASGRGARRARAPRPARGHPRARHGRHPGPSDAGEPPRRARRGLRAHGARQGRARVAGSRRPRLAQRARARRHRARAASGRTPGGRDHHGDGLRLARARPPRRAGHPGTRLPAGAGLRARDRRELRRGQHGGRPAREGVRPAAPRGPAMRRAGARAALAGVTTLVLLAPGGAVAPWLAPAGPYAADLTGRLGPPRDAHLFGQDTLGRDVLARVLYGARISLGVGAAPVVLSP